MKVSILAGALCVLMAGCASAQGQTSQTPAAQAAAGPSGGPAQFGAPSLAAPIRDGQGGALGEALFWETPTGVYIRLIGASGVTPGWHGVHLHEHGACGAPGFTDAGAHAGHGAASGGAPAHGLMNPAGPEAGDLPNIYVSASGALAAELFSTKVTLAAASGRTPLRDADGAALVIHANPDDQTSQPIGGAGPRIACAVIPPAG